MKIIGDSMSQPQATETWTPLTEETQPKQGLGVVMSPEQFEVLTHQIDKVLGETGRREQVVADSLLQLKKIEAVRTYASVIKDITTSIQTLSQLEGTEKAVSQLLENLTVLSNEYKTLGDSGETMESRPSLHAQTNS